MPRIEKVRITRVDRDEAREAHKLAFPYDTFPEDVPDFWVARCGTTVVGFLALFTDERGLFISRVAVAKVFEGNGLGKKLVRFALRYGKRLGYKTAYTYTLLKNYPSMCMLTACGFRYVEPPPEGRYRGKDVHYLARPI